MSEGTQWKRPESVTIPTVWARYESPKPMANGTRPIFRIQDFTEEWRNQVIYNMQTYFLMDEPISRKMNYGKNEKASEEYLTMLKEFLGQKMVLVAIVENLDELGDQRLPALAGCNITGVVTKEEKPPEAATEETRIIFDALEKLKALNDCFEYYGVTEYLYALGLSVDPAYRGHGLSTEILKARFPLCKAVGISVTGTVFTSTMSKRAAQKAGFETLAEIVYDEYEDEKCGKVFEGIEHKTMKFMAIRIP